MADTVREFVREALADAAWLASVLVTLALLALVGLGVWLAIAGELPAITSEWLNWQYP